MIYHAVPHKLYRTNGGEIVHFNESSLELMGLPQECCDILAEFVEAKDSQTIIDAYSGNEEVEEIIDELIELELITSSPLEKSVPLKCSFRPRVGAFRVVLTEKCNLACVECFVTKNRDVLRHMSPETLEKVIVGTIPYGAQEQITYHFFGGEPLIRFDHIKSAVVIAENAVACGKMVRPRYTMTTNLTILTDEMIAFFVKHDFKVGVSVDGPKQINDALRVYRDGRGTYDDVAQNYDRLVKAGIDVHVLVTPHPDFLDELPSIFEDVLKAFPMKTVTVNTPFHFDSVRWTAPGKKYAHMLIKLMRIAREYGVDIDSAASPPLAALSGRIQRQSPCSLICDTMMASVDVDGNMSFCAQKWHSNLTVPFKDAHEKLCVPIQRDMKCLECEAKHICGGPCPAFQQISGSIRDENKCAFMRTFLKEAINNLDLFEEAN